MGAGAPWWSDVRCDNLLVAVVTGQVAVFIVDGNPYNVPTVGPCSGSDLIALSLATAVAEATAVRRDCITRVTSWPCERFAGQGIGQSQGFGCGGHRF